MLPFVKPFLNPFGLSLALIIGCTPVIVIGPSGKSNTPPANTAGIANPASVFCTSNNGRLEIRRETLGEAGYCIFTDRSYCEEWSYYRGECKPGQKFDL
ncbi:hemolysin [bacterium (Candidatus Blackallbacteria) CG18_big_fil_WC_8_21_14_2_50_49_26]|nr:MAG: hemolysin [bacterium (Candidatus Blackallbacteria) CG18_big_fil_WC_8_21_14_2_50_49_26]